MYGKRRLLKTLGRYPDVPLADARKEAKRVQGEVLSIPKDGGRVANLTFEEARERFLHDSQARTKPKTFEEYDRLLRKHFAFEKQLAAISRQDIMETVTALSNKPSVEQHAFVAIRTMMNWCVRHGLLTASPVPPLRFKTESRTRILTDDELRAVWQRAEQVGYPYGMIVQLLILTGQRRGEIVGLRRNWIEGDAIVFPKGFTKNKREHRIPLGPMTKELIDALPGDSNLLFPSRHGEDTPFSGWSKSKREFDKALGFPDYTLHDLRRTYSSNMARLGIPIHVTEKLLNHISGTVSGIAAVYNRHAYMEEMREATKLHDEFIALHVSGDS
jgi:integrase